MDKTFSFRLQLIASLMLLGSMNTAFALVVNSPQAIIETVTVQPIILSDDDGGNTATYFGTPGQQSIIEGFVDNIWAQAGIDVNFLTPNAWNNTFGNWGAGGSTSTLGDGLRPNSDLNAVISAGATAGVTNADPNVINMFFVNISAGFGLLSDNSAAGFARVNDNGITQFVGDNLLGFGLGQEAISSVVAHEIGHNLGLDHLIAFENLMQPGGSPNQGERLNNDQIATALASNFSVAAIPLPAAFWLFGSSLIALLGVSKAKKV